jgi:hypothetical protein
MMRQARRLLDAFSVWAHLAAFGIAIGVLALLRNFEGDGAGGRWRRAHATGAEVDALVERNGA